MSFLCDLFPEKYFFFLPGSFLQATIGIDFLSKTMYLEDRTVSTPLIFLTKGESLQKNASLNWGEIEYVAILLLHALLWCCVANSITCVKGAVSVSFKCLRENPHMSLVSSALVLAVSMQNDWLAGKFPDWFK